jgi:hypothetical protein
MQSKNETLREFELFSRAVSILRNIMVHARDLPGLLFLGLKARAHTAVRPYRTNDNVFSCRGGPLCPPYQTRRIVSGTQGVAPSCTGESAISF